jgi:hypothetical protein
MSDLIQIDIKDFNNIASKIVPEDLDTWVVPHFLAHYSEKIYFLAIKAYGDAARGSQTVANGAFKERAKAEIKSALNTFLFKSEHYKTGRDINSYLLTCLNRLSDKILWDSDNIKKYNSPICPGCKHIGTKSFLNQEDKDLKCEYCSTELYRLPNEILLLKNKPERSKEDKQNVSLFESRLRIHKAFAVHSKKGYRCPDCFRFLPESLNGQYGISCPFNDCQFFGKVDKLDVMPHPVSMCKRSMVSLQNEIGEKSSSTKVLQDIFAADNMDADVQMEIQETFEIEFNQLVLVIDEQIKSVKRINSAGTMTQKLLMYEAYQNMLKDYPEEMISYLVHRKQASDFPIQSRIYQEYVKLMEEALPFSVIRNNKKYTIYNLLDPYLQLFSGKSEFDAFVDHNHTIPNKTVETYVGGVNFKDYGPCFIGMIIDVVNKNTNESIKDKIKNYTFSQINLTNDIEPNTPVLVKHFRIKSHYEIGSLVYLQRIRKRIVDSVYFKLNGKKRIAGED